LRATAPPAHNRAGSAHSRRRPSAARCAGALLCLFVLACSEPPGDQPAAQPAGSANEAAAASEAATAGVRPDVVLITIDTLRADTLGFAGNENVETPWIDRLAASGRVFTYAHAHNVVTLPSHVNIFTGRYPYQHGVRENAGFKLGDDLPTLATLLQQAGYRTGAFVGAFPLDARYGLARGFDTYDDNYPIDTRPTERVMAERHGNEVIALALQWWRKQAGSPRFLWVHLYDAHAPYAPPEPFASRYADNLYLGEVATVDSYLAPLLQPLLEPPPGQGRRPAFVVFTADHGEALGDHGELTHGLFAYEATLKVPLILWGPGVTPGSDDRSVGHVDILPTVLKAVGIEAPGGLPGTAIPLAASSAPPAERDLYFEALSGYLNRGWAPLHGVLADRHKMIRLPLPELYDLATDPAEEDNLIDRERRLANTLRARIPATAVEEPTRAAISQEEASRLRSLGYVASNATPSDTFTPENDPKNLVDIDHKLHRVTLLYSERKLDEAARLAREIIAERPTMVVAYEHLSEALREQGRLDEAITALEGALSHGVTHPSVLRQLGLSLAEAGRGEEAVRVLSSTAGGTDIDSLNALAVAYYSANQLAKARATLNRVLELDAENTKALESLGAVALRENNPAEARRLLERAVALNDKLPFSWNTLGVACQLSGDTGAALAAWERAVELDPRAFDALYNLGWVAASAGRKDLARRALTQYIQTAPRDRYAAEIQRARQALAQLGR
jgi:arylsulfatase A-like enzyme/Flp pilus assembly protein TadD